MYAKLFSRIAQSSLMEERVTTRYVFMMTLALADRNGDVIGTDVAIARMMNVSLEEFIESIKQLQEPDPDSNSQAHEGRRIVPSENGRGYLVVNYNDYRLIKSDEEKRDYMRDYMRKRRENQNLSKGVKSVKLCKGPSNDVTQAEADTDTEAEGEGEERDFTPPTPSLSDKFTTQTTADLESVIDRIRKLRPGWEKTALTYEEMQSVSKNASCLLSIAGDDWNMIGRYLNAKLPQGDASWQPRFRKQLIESAPDVLQHASNWAYKNGQKPKTTTDKSGIWK